MTAARRRSRGRLLVVDDEPDFARFVKNVADGLWRAVRIVSRIDDLQPAMREGRPTVVALDIDMSGPVTLEDGKPVTGCAINQCEFRGHLILMCRMDDFHPRMAAAAAKVRNLRLAAVITKPCRRFQRRDILYTLAGSL